MTMTSPQPGKRYRLICLDGNIPHREIDLLFVNVIFGVGYEVEVAGVRQVIGDFSVLSAPWAYELQPY